jgi:hypothetical protein
MRLPRHRFRERRDIKALGAGNAVGDHHHCLVAARLGDDRRTFDGIERDVGILARLHDQNIVIE